MPFQNQSLKFHSDALGDDTLFVTEAIGSEQLSGQFRFDLNLISSDPKINMEKVLYAPAKLGLLQHLGGDLKTFKYWSGMLEEFEEQEKGQDWVSYKAVLVPDMSKLRWFYRSRIFMEQSTEDMCKLLLSAVGLADGTDFEFNLTASYPIREYAVQYEESDLDFVHRWLEHEGIYYYFENDGSNESVRFADETGDYKPVNAQGSKYPYHPEGAAHSQGSANTEQGESQEEEIQTFKCTVRRLPAKVSLNDYNWRDPNSRLSTTADVSSKGEGLQNEYNDHYKTDSEGEALANVRVQELTCRSKVFMGIGTCRGFRPGRTFELTEHFRSDFNTSYLITEVSHEMSQAINLESGTVSGSTYSNAFSAIPADVVFRPKRTTAWPSINGVMHARVDSGGDGAAADLDDMGRYKIKIPFDEAMDDTPDGEASRYVRMAQPYAGVNSGMHFPLLKGTEVLLAHIDGDPDRPIIAGSVPNPETASPVDSSNASQNRIQTTAGNMMLMDDDADATGFVMASGDGSFIQDFRLPSSGGGGVGAGIGGAPTAGDRARVRVTHEPEEPTEPSAAAAAPRPLLDPAEHPVDRLPPKLRRKLFGPGYGGKVEARVDSLGESQRLADAINTGAGHLGASLSGDYYLDSQIYPKKLEFRIGEIVKINSGPKVYLYDDMGESKSVGTGGKSHHTELDSTESTRILNGTVKEDVKHSGNIESSTIRMGLKKTFELTVDIAEVKTLTGGDQNTFELRSASDQSLKISLGQKGEIELNLGANVMKLEMEAGLRHTMKINAATETEFLVGGGPKTIVTIRPQEDDIKMTWEKWLGIKKDEVGVSKTDTAVQNADTKVQDTKTAVQQTDTAVQNTDTKVQATKTKVQETDTKVQETKTKVQETDTKVQKTETSAQKTDTSMMNTETQAMRTSTSGATMIN